MAKKLTKKQIQELNKIQTEKETLRRRFIDSLKSYWADLDALVRVYNMDKEANKDKLTYSGRLTDEEADKVLKRYANLAILEKANEDVRAWDVARFIFHTERAKNSYDAGEELFYRGMEFQKDLFQNDLFINDIIWSESEVDFIIEMMKKFGYKRLQYFDSSSAASEIIYHLTNKGLKLVDTNATLQKKFRIKKTDEDEYEISKTGLIFELSEE